MNYGLSVLKSGKMAFCITQTLGARLGIIAQIRVPFLSSAFCLLNE